MTKHSPERKVTTGIAKLRDNADLTQAELAKAVGVTETTIANWENGRTEWIEKIILLCDALNCSIKELWTTPINELRERMQPKITQASLAKAVGVRENTVAKWEKRHTLTERIENVMRLCVALGCSSPEELLPLPPRKSKGLSKSASLSGEELLKKFEQLERAERKKPQLQSQLYPS